MIDPGESFESFLATMVPILDRWQLKVVPGSTELLPHNGYAPQYAWMFATEKRLKYRMEEALGTPLAGRERALFGADGVVSECLSNAFVHGNRRDDSRPIAIEVAVSHTAICFRISDDGEGFDVDAVTRAADNGSSYFNFAGNGFRALRTSTVTTATYSDSGTAVALLVVL